MSDQGQAAAAKGQIDLLLEEYRALRSEIDQRIGARATLMGFVAAGAAFILSSRGVVLTWLAAAVFLALLVIVWGSSTAMLGRLGRRVREIERQINLLAMDAYGLPQAPTLMQWETSLLTSPGWIRTLFKRAGLYKP